MPGEVLFPHSYTKEPRDRAGKKLLSQSLLAMTKTNQTTNHMAQSLGLPIGWHVDVYPGGSFVFERYDEFGRIAQSIRSRDPKQTAKEILSPP